MKAKVNRQLFDQKVFDSGALGVLASVMHSFPRPGRYQALVRRNGQIVAAFDFAVDPASTAMQLDIDLATLGAKKEECCGHKEPPPLVVAPKGYLVFFASTGPGGYSVRVGPGAPGKDVEFDSEKLGEGDLFALSLLEPIRYSMNDTVGGGKGEIDVSFKPDDAKRLRLLEPVYVEARGQSFEPAQVRLTLDPQGLVFKVQKSSRIVVTKQGQADEREPGPRIGWHRPKLS